MCHTIPTCEKYYNTKYLYFVVCIHLIVSTCIPVLCIFLSLLNKLSYHVCYPPELFRKTEMIVIHILVSSFSLAIMYPKKVIMYFYLHQRKLGEP